jgi:predicted nucleic acid-binding protein
MHRLITTDCYFDTDLLSSFLMVDEEELFIKVVDTLILIPFEVYDEIKKYNKLENRINNLIKQNKVRVVQIEYESEAQDLFNEFCYQPKHNYPYIGKGEAACLSLAIAKQASIGSNNLKDVYTYCKYYNLKLITTEDILLFALDNNYIDLKRGNNIRKKMRLNKRKLPYDTFSMCVKNRSDK